MKTKHLDPNDLTGYIYRTLDDAQREAIDAHLLDCPTCRGHLSEQALRQQQISNELNAALSAATPSARMDFSAIAPRLQNRRSERKIWSRLNVSAPATLALTGLLLAILGLWQALGAQAHLTSAQPLGAFPTLACFFLMLASVEQFDRAFSIQPRLIAIWIVAAVLWLGSAFIGLLNLIVIRDLAILAVVALDGGRAQAGPVAILAVMLGAMLYIGLVIGGAEYHYKNIGQPGSWKLFSLTLLGQLFLLILPYLVI
jgi:predicted anti-sigma-YlaC factor YlaD